MNYLVKDLMVPISEYATVPVGATLFEAVLALEEAQLNFDRSKYQHRAVLVMDGNNHVVGKLSQLNVLHALGADVDNREIKTIRQLDRFGFSPQFISAMEARRRFAGRSLKDICAAPAAMKVEQFMKATTPGEYVDENATLESVIPQFVYGAHLSLLVTGNGEIVGILRLADVFAAVFHAMEECHHEAAGAPSTDKPSGETG
ncbi:MAG: CBS domain-containing protein [Thermodesulfobacteriota bacterium]|nr:CBS domain-containing protein [Thermodesulfobacteriota bacterium]